MTTAHGDYSPEAGERARRTVDAAAVFGANAEIIVAELPSVPDKHILVALVTEGLELGPLAYVDELELVARVPELEAEFGGWAMVFSPRSTVEDVRSRAGRMGDIARQRAEAIERISARRAAAREDSAGE